jgi:16S rRNA (guanine527-N7)-methyltransferase
VSADAPAFVDLLGDLAGRFRLDPETVHKLGRLAARLATDPEAPTTVREPTRVRDDHIADSLVALELPEVRAARQIADLGAGAGLPGLVLAASLPNATVVLVESNQRKCEFLRRTAEGCGIGNAEVAAARAESIGVEHRERYDLVTARALAPLAVVAEYAAPLLRTGGVLVAWRGRREPQVEAEAGTAAEILGLSVRNPQRVCPYSAAEHRFLHLMSKVSPTPDRFPRRPGVARKRPLGAAAPRRHRV